MSGRGSKNLAVKDMRVVGVDGRQGVVVSRRPDGNGNVRVRWDDDGVKVWIQLRLLAFDVEEGFAGGGRRS